MVQIEGSLRTKDQIGIRPIRVSHFGDFWRAFREERREKEEEEEEKKKKKKKKEKRISSMD